MEKALSSITSSACSAVASAASNAEAVVTADQVECSKDQPWTAWPGDVDLEDEVKIFVKTVIDDALQELLIDALEACARGQKQKPAEMPNMFYSVLSSDIFWRAFDAGAHHWLKRRLPLPGAPKQCANSRSTPSYKFKNLVERIIYYAHERAQQRLRR